MASKKTYNFSTYFNKQELHDSLYGDTVGNFVNQVGQSITNFISQNAQNRMELDELDRQIGIEKKQNEFNIGQLDKQQKLQLDLDTYKRKSANISNNANKWWELQMGGQDGQNGVLNNFGIGDDGKKANDMFKKAVTNMKGAWTSGLASSWGFESEEEFNRYLDDVFNPILPSYDMTMKSLTDNDIRIQSQNNVIAEVNDASADSPTFEWFLNAVNNSMSNNAVNDKAFIVSTVLEGSNNFFSRAMYNDANTAQTSAGYQSREEFIEQQLDSSRKLSEQLISYFSNKGIELLPSEISALNAISNEDNVRARAEKDYDNAFNNSVSVASQEYTTMKAELLNIKGVIDEFAVQKALGIVDEQGSPNQDVSKYKLLVYDQNIGQYIFKHNYEYVTGQVLGDDINQTTAMNYFYDAKGVYDSPVETLSLDESKAVVASDSKYAVSSPYDSMEAGLVLEDGVYTKYTSKNFENARNWLISLGKYENKEDIPNSVLIATTMVMDEALNTVTEESKMSLWNYYTSPYRKEEEVYAGLNMMESLNLYPESKGTTVYDMEHALQKWKEVPTQVKDFMDEAWFKEDLNTAMSSFADLPNSNVEKFKYMFEQQFIDEAKELFQNGRGTDKDLMELQEKLLKEMTITYSNGVKVSNDSEQILGDIENLIEGNNREYEPLDSMGAIQSEIIRTSSGLSPYKWNEVTSMATMIAGGHPESVYQYIADKLNGDIGLTGDSAIVISNDDDLKNLLANGSISGKEKDENQNISKQASYYMNELAMAWGIGAPTQQMIDTFIGNSNTPYLQFYTEDGKTGIFIPSQNGIPSHMFISENMSAGGTYTAYSNLSSDLDARLTGQINKHNTETLTQMDFLSCGTRSTVKNDIGPIQIETNLNKASSVGSGSPRDEEEINEEQARVTEEQQDYYMRRDSLHQRIKRNASYQNFMSVIRMKSNEKARREAIRPKTVNFGV